MKKTLNAMSAIDSRHYRFIRGDKVEKRKKIEVVINGFREFVPKDITISDLIELYNERDGGLIVEQNNRYVFPQRYSSTIVRQGDKIEFINPDFGG